MSSGLTPSPRTTSSRPFRPIYEDSWVPTEFVDDVFRKVSGGIHVQNEIQTLIHVHVRRYNKHIKNLVRDMSHPEAHLANSVTTDVSARYMGAAVGKEYDISRDPHHRCLLSCSDRKWRPNRKVISIIGCVGIIVWVEGSRFFKVVL